MRRAIGYAATAALVLGAPLPAMAGSDGVTPTPGPVFIPPLRVPGPDDDDKGIDREAPPAQLGVQIIEALTAASAFCAALPDSAYQIDCLAERLEQVSRQMPTDGPYAETQAALATAATQLRAVATRHVARSAPRKSFSSAADDIRTAPLRAVEKAEQAVAVAEALVVLDQTQTILLRSSDRAPEVKSEVTQIAAAVGSNKLLLRSA